MLRYQFFLVLVLFCSCNYNGKENKRNYTDIVTKNPAGTSAKELTLKVELSAFNTTVDALFWDTTDSISDIQRKNYDDFISKQEILLPDILNKVFEYYKTAYPDYKKGWTMGGNISEKELEKYLPKPTTPDALKKFITPVFVYIQNKKDCKPGTIGIDFDCTWDIENGLGVKIENWKVTEAGVSETSYFFSGDNP